MLACSFKVARAAYPMSKWPRKVRIGRSGTVLEPASGVFDATVAPGEVVQAAIDRCPPGGSVLLLPGSHNATLFLPSNKDVHVFGRGRATLWTVANDVVKSTTAAATLAGLILRRQLGGGGGGNGVYIKGGRLRLQACDISSAVDACITIEGGADPTVVSCR